MIAGQLEIQLLANLARLQSDMGQAKGIVDRTVRDIESTMGRLKQIFGTGLVAGAFDYVAKQAMEAEQAVNRLDAVIRATGNASGYTKAQLHGMADAMAEATQFDDEDIRNSTASLLKFGNIHSATLKNALKLSADYAAFTGTNMAAASEVLGKALSSPAQGVERLQRSIGYLKPEQVTAIKNMQEMGDMAGAQAALMQILTDKIGGVAEAMNTGYTKAFGDAKKASGEFFEALGGTVVVQVPVQSFLKFVTDSMRDMKHIIEDGDWVQALKFIMGFRQTDAQAAARTPAQDAAANSSAQDAAALEADKKFREALAEQDARFIEGALKRQKEAAKERERIRELELAGEEAVLVAEHEMLEQAMRDEAKLRLGGMKTRDDIRQMDLEGQEWLARNVVDIVEAESRAIEDIERRRVERSAREQIQMWEQVGAVSVNFFADLILHGASAFDRLKQMLKEFLAQMIAIFATRWVLQLGAAATGSTALGAAAGQVGQGTLAGAGASALGGFGSSVIAGYQGASLGAGLAGPTTAGASIFSGEGVGAALAGMGPAGWAVLAVAAVAAVAYAFRDKGENWRAQFGFGDNAQAAYSTEGVFGREGFAQIQGQDAFARAMQEFMAGTRELDRVLASHLSADSIDRIVANLAGPYATRADGQPSEFAFGRGQEGEAAAQLTLEYLQKKYGTVFDEIDSTFADFIRSYTGKAEDLLAEIGAFADLLNALSLSGINGLDIEALRAMQREGEAIGDTFARIAGEMSAMREQFMTEAEKLDVARGYLTGFASDLAALGMDMPTTNRQWLDLFESLDLSTEAGRELYDRMVALAPSFLAVGDAAEQAAADAAAAAATMLASFDSVMGQLRGSPYTRTVLQGQLDSALNQFSSRGSGNNWAMGMSADALMAQLLTITRADFQNYNADMQALITKILTLYSSLQSLTDPISTVGTAVGTALAPAIDTAAIAAGHLNARLALLAQIYELNGDAVSAAAIRDHQRAIALEEIRKQDSANGTPGILEGLTTSLWALQDAAAAAAEAAAAEAELERQQMDAARGVIETMQEIVRAMDQVAAFKGSIGGNIQSIRSGMAGFDAVGYYTGQVGAARIALASATDLEEKLAAGGSLRDAIMGRYQAEVDAANEIHRLDEENRRAAIDQANELNRSYRALGEAAKALLVGDLSPLSPAQKLAESRSQYESLLGRARGGDIGAAGALQGAASTYLDQARGFYASSDAYVRIFGEVQGALAMLGAQAGPDQVYQENTAAWQASLLEIQTRAIDELGGLQELTDAWQAELQERLIDQAIQFTELNLSSQQIAENTKDLDKRIGKIITDALAAVSYANDEAIIGQNIVIDELPPKIARAVAVTDRR